jgi:hypothetical protein
MAYGELLKLIEEIDNLIKKTIKNNQKQSKQMKESQNNIKEVTVTTVSSATTEKIIIPENMTKLEASTQLKKQWEQEETEIDLIHQFKGWNYQDALVAINRTMKKTFGWVAGNPTYGFFGNKSNPKEIDIPINIVDGKTIYESCFVGNVQITQWDTAQMDIGAGKTSYNSPPCAVIKIEVKRKYSERVRKFFAEVDRELMTNSIYRGKSLMVTGQHEDDDSLPFFTFLEPKGAEHIILNPSEEDMIQNFVINPLGRLNKRSMLFVGPYGTGKTETAMRIGKIGNTRGITFIYCKKATLFPEVLEYAKNYQPALIFQEDLDEFGSGEDRDADMNDILNTLDGVQTKGHNITVIFTTNHEKRINKALRRPGRIDVIVKFDKCEPETIARIYEKLFHGVRGSEKLDYNRLASFTPKVQGAVVAEIAKRAKSIVEFSGEVLTEAMIISSINSMKNQIEFMEEDPEKVPDSASEIFNTVAKQIAVHMN